MNNTRNTANNIFANPAAAPAIPVNPRTAAINAITNSVMVQLNIQYLQFLTCLSRPVSLSFLPKNLMQSSGALIGAVP
jgi:hypothetical protein